MIRINPYIKSVENRRKDQQKYVTLSAIKIINKILSIDSGDVLALKVIEESK
jgi:hypothetical protein